jgi:hypothetical protein
MEDSPRIVDEDNTQHLLEKSADAIRISDDPEIKI